MSSHHFVKEGQEPALIIADLAKGDHVLSLLEWAPLVMVLEPALDDALVLGIKIDMVVAKESSLTAIKDHLLHQAPLKIFAVADESEMLATALMLISAVKQDAVNIVTCNVARVLPEIDQFSQGMKVSVIDERCKWSIISGLKFEKWLPAGTQIQIKSKEVYKVSGGEYTDEENVLRVLSDGFFLITSPEPFWVGELF
jgi:hypothetical protein